MILYFGTAAPLSLKQWFNTIAIQNKELWQKCEHLSKTTLIQTKLSVIFVLA